MGDSYSGGGGRRHGGGNYRGGGYRGDRGYRGDGGGASRKRRRDDFDEGAGRGPPPPRESPFKKVSRHIKEIADTVRETHLDRDGRMITVIQPGRDSKADVMVIAQELQDGVQDAYIQDRIRPLMVQM